MYTPSCRESKQICHTKENICFVKNFNGLSQLIKYNFYNKVSDVGSFQPVKLYQSFSEGNTTLRDYKTCLINPIHYVR